MVVGAEALRQARCGQRSPRSPGWSLDEWPVPPEPVRQARQNGARAHKLGSPQREAYDWAITGMFYALVHCVDASLLERHHLIPRGHTARPEGEGLAARAAPYT